MGSMLALSHRAGVCADTAVCRPAAVCGGVDGGRDVFGALIATVDRAFLFLADVASTNVPVSPIVNTR